MVLKTTKTIHAFFVRTIGPRTEISINRTSWTKHVMTIRLSVNDTRRPKTLLLYKDSSQDCVELSLKRERNYLLNFIHINNVRQLIMVKLWRDWSISHWMVHLVIQWMNTLDADNIDRNRETHTCSNRRCIHHEFHNESYRNGLFHKSCRKIQCHKDT